MTKARIITIPSSGSEVISITPGYVLTKNGKVAILPCSVSPGDELALVPFNLPKEGDVQITFGQREI